MNGGSRRESCSDTGEVGKAKENGLTLFSNRQDIYSFRTTPFTPGTPDIGSAPYPDRFPSLFAARSTHYRWLLVWLECDRSWSRSRRSEPSQNSFGAAASSCSRSASSRCWLSCVMGSTSSERAAGLTLGRLVGVVPPPPPPPLRGLEMQELARALLACFASMSHRPCRARSR